MNVFLRLLALAWMVAAGSVGSCLAVTLLRGPELDVTPTNAVVRWTTDGESGSRVQFGVSSGRLDRRAEGAVGTQHRVELPGLKPGTRYHFTVGTSRVPLATNAFVTPPLPGSKPDTNAVPIVESPAAPSTNAVPATQPRPPPSRMTWGTPRTLQDHFDRHGSDFSARNPDDYAAQAWLFLVRARKEGLPAKQDESGVMRVFDPKTGAFAAYNRDGTTRTYFKPGRRDYFADQPGETVDLRRFNSFQPPQ